MSSLRPLYWQAAQHFDERYKRKQKASQNTRFGSLGTELWEPNIFIWVLLSESSIKFLQVAKFLFMYSFTHTNIVFLFKHQYASLSTFVNLSPLTTCLKSDRRKRSRKYPPGTPSTSQLSKDEQELRWNKLLLDDLNNDLIVTKQNLTKSKTLLVTQVIKIFCKAKSKKVIPLVLFFHAYVTLMSCGKTSLAKINKPLTYSVLYFLKLCQE